MIIPLTAWRSLHTRLMLPLLLLGIAMALVTLLLVHTVVASRLEEQVLQRAQTLAESVVHAIATIDQPGRLQRLVTAFGASQGVDFIVVSAGEPARIVASTHLAWLDRLLAGVDELAPLLASPGAQTCGDRRIPALCLVGPIRLPQYAAVGGLQTAAGTILVRLDTGAQRQAVRGTVGLLSVLFGFGTLLLLAVNHRLIARCVLQPLDAIQRVLRRREQGDASARVAFDGEDELATVAATLDTLFDTVTERTEHLRRMTRLYATVSESNQAIVRMRDRRALFERIVRIAVELGALPAAWIGVPAASGRRIEIAAYHGPQSEFIAGQNTLPLDPDDPRGNGPSATALRSGELCVINDCPSDPRTAPWNERARQHGIHSMASIPVRADGEVVAVLTLYAASLGFFDREVLLLFVKMAGAIGFALETFAHEAGRKAAEARLCDSERRYRLLFDANPLPMWVHDRDSFAFLAANAAAVYTFGYSHEEFRAMDLRALGPPALTAPLLEHLERCAAAPTDAPLLWQTLGRGGRALTVEVHAYPIDFEERRGLLVLLHDVTARRQAEERVAYLASHDPLTDLPNRSLLHDHLRQALAMARRHTRSMAVLYIDVDRFKLVNDSLGREAGDRLLRIIANRLRGTLRAGDTVSRIASDEFVVLLNDIHSPEHAGRVADKVRATLSSSLEIDGQDLHPTISLGIALFPDDGADPETLLRNADMAMHLAKESGRDGYRFFTADLDARASERLALENGLRRALERSEFVLHYQPQVGLMDGRLTGFEALLRWQHPEWGLVPPVRFVPVAEETGLIMPIGDWVIGEACRQNRLWQNAGLAHLPIAVNMSALQFRQRDLVERVRTAIAASGLAPDFLEIELTESILMGESETTLTTLGHLKALGVRLAIDDFGTGYSNLGYLKRFAVNKLKIDRSFVRDLAGEARHDEAIVEAIIGLAHSLDLGVIAEGVEIVRQAERLLALGCTHAQGFLFGRPAAPDEARRHLAARHTAPAA